MVRLTEIRSVERNASSRINLNTYSYFVVVSRGLYLCYLCPPVKYNKECKCSTLPVRVKKVKYMKQWFAIH